LRPLYFHDGILKNKEENTTNKRTFYVSHNLSTKGLSISQSTYKPEYHSASSEMHGTPHPLSTSVSPPEPMWDTLASGWGGGGSQFQRLEKKPSTVSTLWSIFVTELSITRTVKLHAKLIKIIDISERISSTCRFVQSILYICFHLIVLMLIVLMKRRKYI
jgi:hypothetical protein